MTSREKRRDHYFLITCHFTAVTSCCGTSPARRPLILSIMKSLAAPEFASHRKEANLHKQEDFLFLPESLPHVPPAVCYGPSARKFPTSPPRPRWKGCRGPWVALRLASLLKHTPTRLPAAARGGDEASIRPGQRGERGSFHPLKARNTLRTTSCLTRTETPRGTSCYSHFTSEATEARRAPPVHGKSVCPSGPGAPRYNRTLPL